MWFSLCLSDADDLDAITHIDHTALNTASHNCTTARDREHILDRHQERLINSTWWLWDILINSRHQLSDFLFANAASRSSKAAKAEPAIIGISSPG
jgi:hypothetical protein